MERRAIAVEKYQCSVCGDVYNEKEVAENCAKEHPEVIRMAVAYSFDTVPNRVWFTYSNGANEVWEKDDVIIDGPPRDPEKFIEVFKSE
ncbi:MAG TPA: hypothetical protein VK253_02915 [Candidatus Binatia bacterium]|nr:hypothetical protein [Candidatus Binatia bacterium]